MQFAETSQWRDGRRHQVGPVTLQFLHTGDGLPSAVCGIETEERETYLLDYPDAEAIAFSIAPTADLWYATESDKEHQPETDEDRGWLRLYLTDDRTRLEEVPGWAGMPFQIGRLLLDAGEGEVISRSGHRTTDYRRSALRKRGGNAKSLTRSSFIHCCAALARTRHPNLPTDWDRNARGLFWAADEAARQVAQLSNEIEGH